jgi:hypothetical protein
MLILLFRDKSVKLLVKHPVVIDVPLSGNFKKKETPVL